MQSAISLADDIDEQAILDMHEARGGGAPPAHLGHWRRHQVWVGGSNYGPHGAAYVPPRHERVPPAMADLVAFMRRDDLPALVQATIAHAQFETIHPFPDGNGRTGRSLIHALLRAKRLTRTVIVPVSAGLLADTRCLLRLAHRLPAR
jgi:Fic family protein